MLEWDASPAYAFPAPSGPIIHGGLVATLLDTAMGGACWSMLEEGETFLTADLHVEFLRSSRPERCAPRARSCIARSASSSARASCTTRPVSTSPALAARKCSARIARKRAGFGTQGRVSVIEVPQPRRGQGTCELDGVAAVLADCVEGWCLVQPHGAVLARGRATRFGGPSSPTRAGPPSLAAFTVTSSSARSRSISRLLHQVRGDKWGSLLVRPRQPPESREAHGGAEKGAVAAGSRRWSCPTGDGDDAEPS